MVTLPNVPKVVRVDHFFSEGASGNMQFREFFQYTGALSVADATTWAANIRAGYITNILPYQSNGLLFLKTELTDLSTVSSPQVVDSTGGSGTDANPPLTAGTALIVQHKIARRYRGGHSRVYLPGWTEERLLNATQWTSAWLTSILSGYNAYIAAATAGTNPAAIGTITHVNVSFYSGFVNHTYPSGRTHPIPTLRVTPLVDPITSVAINPRPGTQRRRNHQSA